MMRTPYISSLAVSAVIVAGLVSGIKRTRADVAYAYAQESISGLTVSGTGLRSMTVTATNAEADADILTAHVSTGTSNLDRLDPSAVFFGAAPTAPENTFSKYSAQGGGSYSGDFTRGDMRINSPNFFTTGLSATMVAESFSSGAIGKLDGSDEWVATGTFTILGDSSVTVSFDYSYDLLTMVSGSSQAPAKDFLSLSISVKDQHGHEVDATPSVANVSSIAPDNTPETTASGNFSTTLSLSGLTVGDTYTFSLQDSLKSLAGQVPEPASLCILGAGSLLLLRRRQ